MKKIVFFLGSMLMSMYCIAQTITLNEFGGWLESAYVEWQPVSEAESYNVYFTGEGIFHQQIDTQLIRCYTDGSYRADVLGLKVN